MILDTNKLEALEAQFDLNEQDLMTSGVEPITGTDEADFLIGSANNEAIAGLAGDDTLSGKNGQDTLQGGEGNDQITTNGGRGLLLGNEGNDQLYAQSLTSEIGEGNSTLLGGQGDDSLLDSFKDDVLFGGSEADYLGATLGKDNLNGGTGDDTVYGGLDDDLVLGDAGNDLISGDGGNDQVDGGEGNDILYDTQGTDRLTGGKGSDSFQLIPDTDTDTILDFQSGQDKLVLTKDLPERGLTFDQLKITESNGNTSISIADTGEILVELAGVSAETINAEDFTIQTQEELLNTISGTEMTTSATESLAKFSTQKQNFSQEFVKFNQPANQNQNEQPVDNQPEQLAPEDQIGAVTSQGVEAMKVDEARNSFDVDGEGIKIGVISDSFDRDLFTDISANDDVLSGDLPGAGNPNGYTDPVSILDDSVDNPSFMGASDEGRAMLQLIHDVAPGAELVFHEAGNSEKELAGAINDLASAGADVIVDDINSFDEPFFQDGLSSQAIDAAVAQGVSYFSAAGNYGNDSYESEFRAVESQKNSTISGLEGYVFHDFNPEAEVDIFQGITLESGEGIDLNFQWDEPFASVGGKGASNDLDIFLLDSENNIVASSTDSNVNKDAVEKLNFAAEEGGEYNLVIGQDVAAGGSTPGFIKYIDNGFHSDNFEYFTGSSTSFGHQTATGTETVGAAAYEDTPEFGTDPAVISESSSTGNTPILFDSQGNRLPEAEIRQNPEIVAPDGTNTTFFISGNDTDEDGFPNFSGTSAAAPHAAAVAALLLEANPNATPEQVYQALETSALDMDNPYTQGFDQGYDPASGYGFIQADRALDEILGTSNTDIASSSSTDFV